MGAFWKNVQFLTKKIKNDIVTIKVVTISGNKRMILQENKDEFKDLPRKMF